MKLSNNSLGVIIWSGNYKKLAKWYQKVIGFKVKSTQDIPGDTYVASVTDVFNELKPKGVKFIAEPIESPEGGYWVTTLQDPEGNLFQFFGGK